MIQDNLNKYKSPSIYRHIHKHKKFPIKIANTVLKIFLILICISSIHCILDKEIFEVISDGIIKKQGQTGYMYGTHVLKNDNEKTLYALISYNIDLDNYIDLKVTVKGDLVNVIPLMADQII